MQQVSKERFDRKANGGPLLSQSKWQALKAICK